MKSVGSELNCEIIFLHEEGFGEDGRDKWRVFSSIVTSPRLWAHKPPLSHRFAFTRNSSRVGLLFSTIG